MITVIGEALIDLVDQAEQTIETQGGRPRPFLAHPGGSPLNVAVGIARLGQPAAFCGRLGHDAFGRIVRAHAARNDVDLSGVIDAPERSTLAVVSIDSDHQASYDFYTDGTSDWQWRPAELADLPRGTTVLHTASLASWLPPGADVIAGRVAAARDAGLLTTYDPNVRATLLPPAGRERIEHMVAGAHLVKASDADFDHLYPGAEVADVAAAWLGLGARVVVVTRGPAGADAFSAGGTVHRDGISVDVVDTVGAGDAFMAGLLAGLADRAAATPDGLDRLAADPPALTDLLGFAMIVSAITCQRAGADPPTADEVAAWRT